jgi:hypothetical protein
LLRAAALPVSLKRGGEPSLRHSGHGPERAAAR